LVAVAEEVLVWMLLFAFTALVLDTGAPVEGALLIGFDVAGPALWPADEAGGPFTMPALIAAVVVPAGSLDRGIARFTST